MSPWRRAAAVLGVLGLVAIVGAGLARTRLDTTVGSFVPASDPAYTAWADVQEDFGADPIVVMLESKQDHGILDAHLPAVLSLEGRLAALDDVAVVHGPGTTLNQLAIRAQELLAEISGQRDRIRQDARATALAGGASDSEAEAAADEASASFDHRYGNLLLGGMSAGLPTLTNPRFTRSVVYDDAGRVRPDLQWLLPDPTHGAILVRPQQILDQAGLADLTDRVRTEVERTAGNVDGLSASLTGAPVVTTALGEKVQAELPRLALVAVALVAIAFAATHRVRWSRRFVPLGVALAATAGTVAAFGWLGHPLSIGVLGFLPILLGVGSDFPVYAARRGGARAILVAAAASAAGFAALALSPLPFVRSLGIALAIGVLLSAILGLLASGWMPAPEPSAREDAPAAPRHTSATRRTALLAATAAVATAAFGWWGLTDLRVEARPDELAAGLEAVDQARQAEDVLGASGEVAVVVDGDPVLTESTLSWFRAADAEVARAMGDRLRPLLSPAQLLRFLGDDPSADQVRAGTDVLPDYLTSAVLQPDGTRALLLFGLELTDLTDQAALVAELQEVLPPPPPGLEVDVVGLPVVAARSVSLLGDARVTANLAGLLGAALVLFLGLRHRRWALVALLSSATAFGWLLAGLHVLDIPLSPLTVALGSLTAAVGGEFTIVALERRALGRPERFGPVETAALTSAAGFLAMAASDLAMLRSFGLVLVASVALTWASARLAVWVLGVLGTSASPRDVVETAHPLTVAHRPLGVS